MNRKDKLVQFTRQNILKNGKHISFDQIPKSSLKPSFIDKLFKDHEASDQKQRLQKQQKGDFVQNYKKNLRRTIYNQTKVMLRTKKQKSQNIQRNPKSNIKAPIPIFQQKTKRTHTDSLYKTIISKRCTHLKKKNHFQLGVNKFPLVLRKNQSKYDDPYNSKIFGEKQRKILHKKKYSHVQFEKQDIQPWQTLQVHY